MKKGLSLFLSLLMIISIITSVPLTVYAASGSNYTSSTSLAAKLDQVFSGDIDIYSNSACTTEVSMPVGTSMSTSSYYWVKSNTSGNTYKGRQCCVYANAVYNKLFNEWVQNGSSLAHSQNVITPGKKSVSYSDFVNAGVRTGAYIRTTNNSSGAYNGNDGHSMIVLSYDSSNIIYLEGNGDGNGAIRITTRTWSAFNTSQLSNKNRYMSFVIQPTEAYYQSLYQNTSSTQTYTISYNANGGYGAPASQTKIHGVALKLSTSVPTRIGYTLLGWSYTPTGTPPVYSVGGTFEVNANTTLYAIWKPNTYSIVYNGNGNTGGSTATSSHQYCDSFVTSFGEYYKANEFMQTGHDLAPVIDSGGTGKYLIEFDLYSDVAGKMRVYMQNGSTSKYHFWQEFDATTSWKHYSFYVDVELQDSSVTQSMLAFYGTYGTGCNPHVKYISFTKANENLSVNGFTRTGYSFLGWSKNPNATEPTYTNKQQIKNLTSVNEAIVNLFAIWKPNTYNILYNANGGSGTVAGSTVNYSSEFSLKPGAFTKTGYSFVGWNAYRNSDNKWYVEGPGWQTSEEITSNSYSKKVYQDSVTMIFNDSWFTNLEDLNATDTFTFYAVWKPESYIVTFDDNDGDTADNLLIDIVTYDSPFGELPTPTRSGYTFNGWFTSPNGGTKITPSTIYTTAGGTTLYAHWTKNHSHSYTGTVTQSATCTEKGVKTFTCSCGDSYTQPISATGHNLSDWITDKEASVYKAGSKHQECTDCGEVLETAKIAQIKCFKPTLKSISNTEYGVLTKWGKVKGADRYRVYRKTSESDWKYIGYTTNTYYTDKTAKSGTKYYYAVRAKNEAGVSSRSSALSKYYLADPMLKSIANTEYGVLIKWGTVKGAEKYSIYRKVKGGEYKYIGVTGNTYYTDKTAKSGTKYYYAIRAKKSETVSSLSSSLSKYYLADPTLNTPSSTTKGIGLRWSKVRGAEGYIIYRKTGSGSYTKLKTEKGVSNLTYRDTSARKGKTYTYKVKAYKSKTYSAYSNAKKIKDKY